jgi:hypothetical protein
MAIRNAHNCYKSIILRQNNTFPEYGNVFTHRINAINLAPTTPAGQKGHQLESSQSKRRPFLGKQKEVVLFCFPTAVAASSGGRYRNNRFQMGTVNVSWACSCFVGLLTHCFFLPTR